VEVKSAGGTCVNGMIYPYAVYVPEAVNVIIVLEPEVVIVGLPVVVPVYFDVGIEIITTPEPPDPPPDPPPPPPPPPVFAPPPPP
jgi:hypothetical protein